MVFDSGVPLVMAALDVTHQFVSHARAIASRPSAFRGRLAGGARPTSSPSSPTTTSAATTSTGRRRRARPARGAGPDPPGALRSSGRATSGSRHVGELTRGMTVIDQRTITARPPANCDMLVEVDAAAAWEVVLDAIGAARCSRFSVH